MAFIKGIIFFLVLMLLHLLVVADAYADTTVNLEYSPTHGPATPVVSMGSVTLPATQRESRISLDRIDFPPPFGVARLSDFSLSLGFANPVNIFGQPSNLGPSTFQFGRSDLTHFDLDFSSGNPSLSLITAPVQGSNPNWDAGVQFLAIPAVNGLPGEGVAGAMPNSVPARIAGPIAQGPVTLNQSQLTHAIVDGAVKLQALDHPPTIRTEMRASFTPNFGLSLADAAHISGFTGYNWISMVTHDPGPTPIFAGSDPSTPLTVPWIDPPLGGYTHYNIPDPPTFPFYCASATGEHTCFPNATTLLFSDFPNNSDLKGLKVSNPAEAYTGFTTSLVGVRDSGLVENVFTWDWKSTFDGTSGGIPKTFKNYLPPDPGSGEGEITILSINGVPVEAVPEPSTWLLLSSGIAGLVLWRKRQQCVTSQ